MLYFYYGVAKVREKEIREVCGVTAPKYTDTFFDDGDLDALKRNLRQEVWKLEKEKNPNTNLDEEDIEIVIRRFHDIASHQLQGLREE